MYKLTPAQIETVINNASRRLFEYCQKHHIHYTVTGVSGGLDSAVTLGLAEQASLLAKKNGFKLHQVGVILPCQSDADHVARAEEVIHKFKAQRIMLNLDRVYEQIDQHLLSEINVQIRSVLHKTGGQAMVREDQLVAQGNIKARLRMMVGMYHTARLLPGIVLSTDNYSELLMGFWTICGDVGDFGMTQKIFKGMELYDIARRLGVPDSVIEALPDDGLGIKKGGDEAQLGVSYPTLDRVMIKLIQRGYDPDQVDHLPEDLSIFGEANIKQIQALWERSVRTRYKRQGTIILERRMLGLPEVKEIVVE
jgi:NAD+ synthetase